MELKGRLLMIALFVPKCRCLCDVGTDHAYIPVYLVQKGICDKALAMDINEGPIEAASENIKHFGLTNKIETRLGSGLEPLNTGEADAVVIAGMGGILIKDILEASLEKAKLVNTMILQPMNAIEVLREWLYENGFEITDEALTNEEAKIYNALTVKWTGKKANYEVIDCYIGKHLIEKGGSLFETFIKRKINQANKVIEGLGKSSEPDAEYLRLQQYLRDNYINILSSIGGNED
jgi:Predicted SAM-dependent methyltransferase